MTITERTLRKWRMEALQVRSAAGVIDRDTRAGDLILCRSATIEWSNRMLRLTQVLLDQHLLRKVRR